MFKNNEFSDWNSYYLNQSQKGVSNDVLNNCKLIVHDLKIKFNLNDEDFSLGETMITYYVGDKLFGNVKFNKK